MAESLKETLSASPENACRPVLLVAIRGQTGGKAPLPGFCRNRATEDLYVLPTIRSYGTDDQFHPPNP